MIPIGIQYSNDGGTTWSTALTLKATNLRVTEVSDADNGTVAVTGKRFPIKFTYLFVLVEFERDYFDPANATYGASANTNWAYIETACAAKLIRIYNNDTTNFPNWDGHTEFNASNNTNYLLLESNTPKFWDNDVCGASGQKLRTMVMELQGQSAI